MTDSPAGVRFLEGRRVYLRSLESGDIPLLSEWANDPELRALTGEVWPTTPSEVAERLDRHRADRTSVWFAVVLKEGDRPIGECGLLRIFHPWRQADLSIILGERSARGQGYGTEAIILLLEYAFGYLGLHRVSIGVVGFNTSALAFYEKIGFRREGVLRDGYYHAHRFSDFVMLSLLEDEYRTRRGLPPEGATCAGGGAERPNPAT